MNTKKIFGIVLILISISMIAWKFGFFMTILVGLIILVGWLYLGTKLFLAFFIPKYTPCFLENLCKKTYNRKNCVNVYLKIWLFITIFILIFMPFEKSLVESITGSLIAVLAFYFAELGVRLLKS